MINPKLYEINTRVWIKRFGSDTKLSEIPVRYFNDLKLKGINIVWLMGLWKTCASVIEKSFNPDLVSSYHKALNDWKKEDVIGSPFAIDEYEINLELGSKEDLLSLREKLNSIGIKLFLDFIPNHFSAGSSLIKEHPEYFLQADEEIYQRDPHTFFKYNDKIFAHGRDPLFPAWDDTIQVNFFNTDARNFQIENLLKLAECCDGVRCDMAMLVMNNIFYSTWSGVLNKFNIQKINIEFWKIAVEKVKEKYPDFIFLAETYWDLEWDLQQLGFDFTYDKRLTDRLLKDDIEGVKSHLYADKSYQMKSVRFIENHDEERAVIKFGNQRSLAAATIISTIMGMKLYYDGQFEGKRVKLPVQLGREPNEKVSETKKNYYYKLLGALNDEIFIKGNWNMLYPSAAANINSSFNNILAWQWEIDNQIRIIVVNYSDLTAQCRLKLKLNSSSETIELTDVLNNQKYSRKVDEINSIGLFIELKAYNSHIFAAVI